MAALFANSSLPLRSNSEVVEPDVQEQRTPLLEVKLQRPIVIRIVSDCWCASTPGVAEMDPGGDDGGKLGDDHKKVGAINDDGIFWRELLPWLT